MAFTLVGVLASGAGALTLVLPTPHPGEVNLEGVGGIIDHYYGWGNVSRVDDAIDQIWWEYNGGALATAKYAMDAHQIGYTQGMSGGSTVWSNTSGYGYNVVGSFAFNFQPNDFLRFNLKDLTTGMSWSSLQTENNDGGLDHMVAYRINSGASAGNYVLAWEDRTAPSWDRDYNDMVLEVHSVNPPVPEPASLVLLGLGLVGVGGWRLRRRA